MMIFLAENMPKLVTDNGTATAIGIWVLMAIMAGAGGLFIYNQILAAKVSQKVLNAPVVTQQQIAQPLIVAMEKEFVHRRDYDRDWETRNNAHAKAIEVVKDRVEVVAKYTGDRIHEFAKHIATVEENAQKRNERLAAMEADVRTLTRTVGNFDGKLDRLIDAAGELRGRAHGGKI